VNEQMSPEKMGLLVQILRGLDNGMPQGLRAGWEKMTPDFQAQKQREAQMQAQQEAALRSGGGAEVAPEMAEYEQYRRARR
jgi:hypothetical protein